MQPLEMTLKVICKGHKGQIFFSRISYLEHPGLLLRIDYCDQRRFWQRSYISGASGMIWTHYISLEASEFSLSYHITKIIIRL